MPLPPIHAIAFDLDDTLISREAAFLRLITNWLKELGDNNPCLLDEILIRDERGNSDRGDFFDDLARRGISPKTCSGIRIRFTRELPLCFQPDATVHAMLNRLRGRNLELAILTNGGSKMQRAKIKNAGLASFFEPQKILISGEIGHDKPSVEAFNTLTERLNSPPENTLFVGDHPMNDIAGAAACGFQTCWKSSGTTEEIERPQFDFKIAGVDELEGLSLDGFSRAQQ